MPNRHGAPSPPAKHLISSSGADIVVEPSPPPKTGLSPGSHSSERREKLPTGLVRPPPVLLEESAQPLTQQHGENKNHRREATQTPKWHAENSARKKGCTARTGDNTNVAGTKRKKKEPDQKAQVWGVSCYYLSCISKKTVVDTNTLRKRDRTQNRKN